MKKVSEQRENNTDYLLDAVISELRRLQDVFRGFSDAHKQFVEDELPRLMIEAVSKAEQTRSKERIDRLSVIVIHTLQQGPDANLDTTDEMLRVSVDLSEEDVDILVKMYSVQFRELARRVFLPELNIVNNSWKDLQSGFPVFRSSKIHSICAKLQSFGLVTQVTRIPTVLDLTSIPYAILRSGADYVEAIGRAHIATIFS
jgi:hypothetical protein